MTVLKNKKVYIYRRHQDFKSFIYIYMEGIESMEGMET